MKIQSVRGMNDIYQPEITLWHEIEESIRQTCRAYGYSEIRTPIVENTDLFKRGVGEDTDVVEKEMYTFSDRNGDSLTLRPEGTAGVVRAVNEHGLLNENPMLKLYYIGQMYRHERPQKGRYRQFYQFGLELIGSDHPLSDVEVMALQQNLLKKAGIADMIKLHISSVGCSDCRPQYKEKLIKILEAKKDQLPEDVQKRMYTNPQRIFDHKDEKVQKIAADLPVLLDSLCEKCSGHHEAVQRGLKVLKIDFVVDPKIVRGLDYYTQTAFEFVTDKLGAQATVCGGGRYNKLFAKLDGVDTPAVGFGVGIERFALLMEQVKKPEPPAFDFAFVYPDEKGLLPCIQLCETLRQQGFRCEIDYQGRSMKSQMKRADRLKARYAVILGGNEIEKGVAVVKDMTAQTQQEYDIKNLVETLKTKVGAK